MFDDFDMDLVERSAWETCTRNYKYELSPFGFIRNRRTRVIRKPHVTSSGYFQIDWNLDGRTYKHLLHRLVAEAYIPNPDECKRVRHKDGNKQNNRIGNLEWIKPKREVKNKEEEKDHSED